MITFLSTKHSKGPAKSTSETDGTLSGDSQCWETVQIGEYRLIFKNQYSPFYPGQNIVDIYNWEKYSNPYPSATTFSLTQE